MCSKERHPRGEIGPTIWPAFREIERPASCAGWHFAPEESIRTAFLPHRELPPAKPPSATFVRFSERARSIQRMSFPHGRNGLRVRPPRAHLNLEQALAQ